MVQGEEDSKRVMMSVSVASVKGGDHFKKEGTVSRLELADKPCKSWCCQIKYRVPYMIDPDIKLPLACDHGGGVSLRPLASTD